MIITYIETMFICKSIDGEKEFNPKWAIYHQNVGLLDQQTIKKVHFIL